MFSGLGVRGLLAETAKPVRMFYQQAVRNSLRLSGVASCGPMLGDICGAAKLAAIDAAKFSIRPNDKDELTVNVTNLARIAPRAR